MRDITIITAMKDAPPRGDPIEYAGSAFANVRFDQLRKGVVCRILVVAAPKGSDNITRNRRYDERRDINE